MGQQCIVQWECSPKKEHGLLHIRVLPIPHLQWLLHRVRPLNRCISAPIAAATRTRPLVDCYERLLALFERGETSLAGLFSNSYLIHSDLYGMRGKLAKLAAANAQLVGSVERLVAGIEKETEEIAAARRGRERMGLGC